MKTNKLLLILLIFVVSFSSYGQNPFTEMLNDPATRAIIDSDIPTRDQVIVNDLIVIGSACVGVDCVNNENFGFDTFRMKENNLRMHFEDTSSSGSFPSADWRFIFNDSANGGANYFAVEHSNTSRQIFKVEAGGPANSLYVEDSGEVGLGTSNPVLKLHMTKGDSPGIRIEQDGSSGFTPQTWDVAGNEANFFVRDATNGSKLPFKIVPNSDTNLLYLKGSSVGIGTTTPDSALDVNGAITTGASGTTGGVNVVTGDINVTDGHLVIGTISGNPQGGVHIKQDAENFRAGLAIESSSSVNKGFIWKDGPRLVLDGTNMGNADITLNPIGTGNVGIGVAIPTTKLDVNGTITTPGGNSDDWNAASSNFNDTTREMAALQSQVDDLVARIEAMESCGCYNEGAGDLGRAAIGDDANVTANRAFLSQNIPNPFDNTTSISYFVPFVNSNANIVISNATGQILENRSIDKFGEGSVIVSKARMSTGIYFYTLYVDGKKIDTKRMVVE